MDLFESFLAILRSAELSPLFQAVDFVREMDISRGMSYSSLQDPLRFRARYLGLAVAEVLVDEKGNLRLDTAQDLLRDLEKKRYLIGPYLENDPFLFEHIRASLAFLVEQSAVQKLLQKLALPLCHKGAERLIRDSIWPRQVKQISISDVKKSILAAWFTWLRQTTGSCFATAPAILIQHQQPLQFLQDLFDLLTFGSLRRVIGGTEYAVPLCPTLEEFDLIRPLEGRSAEILSLSPGLRAALSASGHFPSRSELAQWIAKEEDAKTPKELIQSILLRRLELEASDIKEEEELKRLEMNPLLAKQSAIYYQKPSPRAQRVSQWKEAIAKACSAYQALGDCALLRAWEATVASFSDVKVDIAKWNLYVSMGLHPEYVAGIGSFLYQWIHEKLQLFNREIERQQGEYERLIHFASNAERMGLTGEYNSAMYQAHAIASQVNERSVEAKNLSELLPRLIQGYDRLIPDSFQEIFDPALAQNSTEMIDDSPAGFRLTYKYSRSTASLWTYIRTSDEFIRALREFFSYAEQELCSVYPKEKKWIEEVSTDLIQYIQTDEFLHHSMERVKANPAIQNARAKPWEYISGGTMPALLQVYYNRTAPFSSLQRKIHTTEELLAFLIDSAHESSHTPRLLIHSPTHAFLLRLDWMPRDPLRVIHQMQQFWSRIPLQDEYWLAEKLSLRLPEQERALFLHRCRQEGPREKLLPFRQLLLETLSSDREPMIDGFLYESLPLIEKEKAVHFAAEILGVKISSLECLFDDSPWITPTDLREKIKILFSLQSKSPFDSIDIDEKIANALRERGFASPKPILFADTNWSAGLFGLAISPSGALDLWRFQRTAMIGSPMRKWFSLQCNGDWTILYRPQEYSPP